MHDGVTRESPACGLLFDVGHGRILNGTPSNTQYKVGEKGEGWEAKEAGNVDNLAESAYRYCQLLDSVGNMGWRIELLALDRGTISDAFRTGMAKTHNDLKKRCILFGSGCNSGIDMNSHIHIRSENEIEDLHLVQMPRSKIGSKTSIFPMWDYAVEFLSYWLDSDDGSSMAKIECNAVSSKPPPSRSLTECSFLFHRSGAAFTMRRSFTYTSFLSHCGEEELPHVMPESIPPVLIIIGIFYDEPLGGRGKQGGPANNLLHTPPPLSLSLSSRSLHPNSPLPTRNLPQ
ncbi:hypothetical protein L249_0721 [Ophiocordyceps polyrhachis-furcata BCC 54312]|uniref:Uncharacterized protein n=1 Tax=Ophiocordyceps polyrhachis-furcata BCC 54312 TaxID=1330021 RepID=A0A367LEE4_9HYPO|nr:hypothetical protein L249_0721 [Ophiocordyceps polyrhachis-furcata BCC 54312]